MPVLLTMFFEASETNTVEAVKVDRLIAPVTPSPSDENLPASVVELPF